MIKVDELHHYYGRFHALRGLNFELPSGRITGFIGPNGAGKSTTLKILCGSMVASSGSICHNGIDILEAPQRARQQIGYMPETPVLYRHLRVHQYLEYIGCLKQLDSSECQAQIRGLLTRFRLDRYERRLVGNLSKGNRQRLALAQALLGQPTILLLDEPMASLDPVDIIEIRNAIREQGGEATVLLSSHNLAEVEQVCDDVLFIRDGEIAYHGAVPRTVDGAQIDLVLYFSRMEAPWLELLRAIPGVESVNAAETAHAVNVAVSDSSKFYPSFYQQVSKHNLPLRELVCPGSKLENFFSSHYTS